MPISVARCLQVSYPSHQEVIKEMAEKDVLQKRVVLLTYQAHDLIQTVSDVQFVKDRPGLLFIYDPFLYAAKRELGGTHRSP